MFSAGDRVHRRRRDTQGLQMHDAHDIPEEDRPNRIPMVPLAPVTAADDAITVSVPSSSTARPNSANQITAALAHIDTRMRELLEEPSMNVELPNETSIDLKSSGSSNVPMPARARLSASMRISSRAWSAATTPSTARNASSATTPATNAYRRRSRPITIPLYSHNPHDVAKLLRGLGTPQQVPP
ncbi:hypothetical protein IAQ61_002861 [Plenodomus lingam]|uniref:uncharacterized protein n=1 Tax=Leptosphaeria maculans TaxID=5022 RepID=UPI003333435A|nr:hypothetical protein IAQ61_002861 [Plenodomus lingam]